QASSRRATRRRPPWPRRASCWKAGRVRLALPLRGEASARALLRHVLAQLLQRGALQSGDMHLADPETARDLRLRHLLVKPHRHDGALSWRQVLHGAIEHVAHLDPFELGIGAAYLLRHGSVVLPIARPDRLVE